jgi:hypothetical protein
MIRKMFVRVFFFILFLVEREQKYTIDCSSSGEAIRETRRSNHFNLLVRLLGYVCLRIVHVIVFIYVRRQIQVDNFDIYHLKSFNFHITFLEFIFFHL